MKNPPGGSGFETRQLWFCGNLRPVDNSHIGISNPTDMVMCVGNCHQRTPNVTGINSVRPRPLVSVIGGVSIQR